MKRSRIWWDVWWVSLAQHISTASKDPSTKVGAVIVDEDNRFVSMGYNGFPKDMLDYPEHYANRDIKNKKIIHAEENAFLFANRSCKGCILYTYPFQPCSKCARIIIQKGIRLCVAPQIPNHLKDRWGEDMALAASWFQETGVGLVII